MTETEARDLAHEISRHPGWFAWAGERPAMNRDNHDWWVWAHHDSMRSSVPTLYSMLPITSRQEWAGARTRWR